MAINQIDKAAQLDEEERLKREAEARRLRIQQSVDEYAGFYQPTQTAPVVEMAQGPAFNDPTIVNTTGEGDDSDKVIDAPYVAPVSPAKAKLLGDVDTLLNTGKQVQGVNPAAPGAQKGPIVDVAAQSEADEREFKAAAIADGVSNPNSADTTGVDGSYDPALTPGAKPPVSNVPTIVGTNAPLTDLTNGNNSQDIALKNNVNPATASFMAMDKLVYDQYGRVRIPAQEWGMSFDTGFTHAKRDYSDTNSLFQGLLAGGVAVLGAALMGGNKQDLGAAFFMAGTHQFGKAINESARYKNIESLTKQGFTPQSIEQYITTGNREDLKKHEIEDWKEYPDGSGRMYRTLPDGSAEVMKGNPKYEPIDIKEGWQTVRKFYNPHYGFQKNQDQTDVQIVLDTGDQAKANYNATLARNAPKGTTPRQSVNSKGEWLKSDSTGETFQAVRGNDGYWYDYVNNQRLDALPTDIRTMTPAEITAHGKQVGLNTQATASAQHGQEMLTYNTRKIYDENGKLITTPPKQGNAILDGVVNGNWAIPPFGGGRGELPAGENWLSSFSPEVRDVITDAKVIQGQIRQLAIQQAKAAGASGINTVAEIKLFAESFPPIDFRSYEGMVKSMDNLRKYYDVYFNRYLEKLNASPSHRVGSKTADGQESPLSYTGSGDERQEQAAWDEMKVYYGGGRGAQYLTPEMAELERKRLNGQGTQPGTSNNSVSAADRQALGY